VFPLNIGIVVVVEVKVVDELSAENAKVTELL
jgi:hypothetical protein